MFEKGPYNAFANCGLPYYVGGVIPQVTSGMECNGLGEKSSCIQSEAV